MQVTVRQERRLSHFPAGATEDFPPLYQSPRLLIHSTQLASSLPTFERELFQGTTQDTFTIDHIVPLHLFQYHGQPCTSTAMGTSSSMESRSIESPSSEQRQTPHLLTIPFEIRRRILEFCCSDDMPLQMKLHLWKSHWLEIVHRCSSWVTSAFRASANVADTVQAFSTSVFNCETKPL